MSLVLCGLIPVTLLAGCSDGRRQSARHVANTAAASAATTASQASQSPVGLYEPTTAEVPDLSAEDIRVVVSGKALAGQREYGIPEGVKAGSTLAVAVHCQGSGKLLIKVQPLSVSIPVDCEKRIVPSLNEVGFGKDHEAASISFVPSGRVEWSFAAGWDANPPDRK
ncbi:hypothetical protein [Streptomyces sp. Midd1]|uniref:hypothetical protein n=1 Tax=Streptomyces sp. Midd3 TaxID=3161191 RepID=UPI0034DB2AF5